MKLDQLLYGDANYYLHTGAASQADAEKYCELWNNTKASTRADVVVIDRYCYYAHTIRAVPQIVITDIRDAP